MGWKATDLFVEGTMVPAFGMPAAASGTRTIFWRGFTQGVGGNGTLWNVPNFGVAACDSVFWSPPSPRRSPRSAMTISSSAGAAPEPGGGVQIDHDIVLGHCVLHFGRAAHRIYDVAGSHPDRLIAGRSKILGNS
jgi:hypothetical protein